MASDISIIAIFMNASWLVQLVLLVLLLASIVSWAVILQNSSFVRMQSRIFKKFEALFYAGGDLFNLYKQVSAKGSRKSGIESVFFAGTSEFLRLSKYNNLSVDTILQETKRAMQVEIMKEQQKLEGNLAVLATVQSISPYVGLLGTIWGIMHVFKGLGTGQATLAVVAPGISEALIATAIGLLAAIPAGVFYNKFITKIDHLTVGYNRIVAELSGFFAKKCMVKT